MTAENIAPILSIEHLRVSFSREGEIVQAITDATLEVPAGGGVGLVGESGSGKSTLARAVLGLLPRNALTPEAARFAVAGKELSFADTPALAALRGRKIAMVFQDPLSYLNPLMLAGGQIREAVRLHDPDVDVKKRIAELLDLVKLPVRVARAYPHELSGGMRQRVLIAIALACRPQLLIADEPTTALDVTTQADILVLLRELRRELKMALLLISHDLGTVATLCDRVYVMYAGKTIESGPRANVFAAPRHPYSRGLLRAAHATRDADGRFVTLSGDISRAVTSLGGCPFAPRCESMMDICQRSMPSQFSLPDEPGHWTRCWLHAPALPEGELHG
jgi:oligopeptide/dipeptide ABC transporter ATP-binding protein